MKTAKKLAYIFNKIAYDAFERLASGSHEYDQTEIDGHTVIAAMQGGRCIGLWYQSKNFGTSCDNFQGCEVSYAEHDPLYPW